MRRISILFAAILTAASLLPADTFYNNLGTTVRGFGSVAYYQGLYNGFTTGSTGENLTDVQVKLSLLDDPSGSVTVALYASTQLVAGPVPQTPASGLLRLANWVKPAPGMSSRGLIRLASYSSRFIRPVITSAVGVGAQLTVIGTINDNSVTSSDSGQNYDFPVNPGYPLSPNTLYFIGLTTTNESEIGWAWNDESDSVAGVGTAGQYNCYGDTGYCRPNGGGDPFLMLVNGGASVPALSPYALVPLSLLLLAIPLWMIRKKYRFET